MKRIGEWTEEEKKRYYDNMAALAKDYALARPEDRDRVVEEHLKRIEQEARQRENQTSDRSQESKSTARE